MGVVIQNNCCVNNLKKFVVFLMFLTSISCFPLQTLTKLRLARHPLSSDEKKAFEVIAASDLHTNEVEKFVEKEDRE